MPSLRCPECGKELLPIDPHTSEDDCMCSQCGRNVYARTTIKTKVKCPQCDKENERSVIF